MADFLQTEELALPRDALVSLHQMVDRVRAIQHFGSEEVMDSLVAKFPATVRATAARLKDAHRLGKRDELLCLLYQLRGAASWACAEALSRAALTMIEGFDASDHDPASCTNALHHLLEEIERTCEAIESGNKSAPIESAPSVPLGGHRQRPQTRRQRHSAEASTRHERAGSSPLDDSSGSSPASSPDDVLPLQCCSLFHSMAERFPLHFERTLQQMRTSSREREWSNLMRRAHSLKCGAAMMGAMQLCGAAEALEVALRGAVQLQGAAQPGDSSTAERKELHDNVKALLLVIAVEGQKVTKRLEEIIGYFRLTATTIQASETALSDPALSADEIIKSMWLRPDEGMVKRGSLSWPCTPKATTAGQDRLQVSLGLGLGCAGMLRHHHLTRGAHFTPPHQNITNPNSQDGLARLKLEIATKSLGRRLGRMQGTLQEHVQAAASAAVSSYSGRAEPAQSDIGGAPAAPGWHRQERHGKGGERGRGESMAQKGEQEVEEQGLSFPLIVHHSPLTTCH